MLQKVEMYTVICDNCHKDIGSEQDYSCWNDDLSAEDNANESDWFRGCTKTKEGKDGQHFCPECFSHDDDENFIIDKSRKNKYALKEAEVKFGCQFENPQIDCIDKVNVNCAFCPFKKIQS